MNLSREAIHLQWPLLVSAFPLGFYCTWSLSNPTHVKSICVSVGCKSGVLRLPPMESGTTDKTERIFTIEMGKVNCTNAQERR